MGNGMNKVLPGLYVGNIRDSKDPNQLKENKITHILSIHDNAKSSLSNVEYLCIAASDHAQQDLLQFIEQTNDFIHRARVNGGNVLVHCLAGVSRSVTVTVVYVMTVTNLNWRDALNAVRGARRCANPNFGFQRQLLQFQHERVEQEKERLACKFKSQKLAYDDIAECKALLEIHHRWVINGEEGPAQKEKEDDLYPLPLGAYGKTENHPSKESGPGATPGTSDRTEQGKSVEENNSESSPSEIINQLFCEGKLVSEAKANFSQNLSYNKDTKNITESQMQATNDPKSDDFSTKPAEAAAESSKPRVSAEQTVEEMFKKSEVR